jgi:hypothetical protein
VEARDVEGAHSMGCGTFLELAVLERGFGGLCTSIIDIDVIA